MKLNAIFSCALAAQMVWGAAPPPETVRAWQARKFGLFIHFGLYSVAGGVWNGTPVTRGYSEQIMGQGGIAKADYEKLAGAFNPVKWDPDAVARLARSAGMRFIVITSKHHDGFNLFQTKQTPYNAVDGTPYGRDIIKGLSEACARHGLKFGVYYSTIDWHYAGATGPDMPRNNNPIPKTHEDFNVAQLKELMTGYGPMSEIWFDMGEPTPEQSRRFAATVHALQPDCMVSGRVFNHAGDFTVMGDNAIPEYIIDEPWQTPASIYHETWGYRSWQKHVPVADKINEHIVNLVKVVSRGGNYLLNIGPRGDGSIVEFEASVLNGMGRWLERYGEAIYDAEAQPFRRLAFGHATVKGQRLYLFVRERPADGVLRLPGLKTVLKSARVLGGGALKVTSEGVVLDDAALDAPFGVVECVFEGVLSVFPPVLGPFGDVFALETAQADRFMNYNGRGYYERPSVYKLEWHFAAAPGRYRIEAPAGVEIRVDGVKVDGAATLSSGEYHTLTVTPPRPFEKGTKLAPVERVRLTKEKQP